MFIDTLRDNEPLLALLTAYAELKARQPDRDWHDRQGQFRDLPARELSRLHGMLLANGWIESRVHADAFHPAGRVADVYRVTHDGIRTLRELASETVSAGVS